jgi:hypothetical protein
MCQGHIQVENRFFFSVIHGTFVIFRFSPSSPLICMRCFPLDCFTGGFQSQRGIYGLWTSNYQYGYTDIFQTCARLQGAFVMLSVMD